MHARGARCRASQDGAVQASTIELFQSYLRQVTVRMQLYKDDLLVRQRWPRRPRRGCDGNNVAPTRRGGASAQAACLRLLLAAPRVLVDVAWLVRPLQLALRLGLSFPPLAVAALDGPSVLRAVRRRAEAGADADPVEMPTARGRSWPSPALDYWIGLGDAAVVDAMCPVLPSLHDYLTATADAVFEGENQPVRLPAVARRSRVLGRGRDAAAGTPYAAAAVPVASAAEVTLPASRTESRPLGVARTDARVCADGLLLASRPRTKSAEVITIAQLRLRILRLLGRIGAGSSGARFSQVPES